MRCHRSEAYCKAGEVQRALEDAELCIQENPNLAMAFARKGEALLQLGRAEEALRYDEGRGVPALG